ncbi:MAG: porphobilinogen synthase [Candidatus Omnitrophica bacterium]|nr:porphobilinogen synthase [Candidatus Omnitrophota bacterium]MCB9784618.1 porphobilinogen synthase [Candidatus Omnitrophota bacterium]
MIEHRPRRNRRTPALRSMVRETDLKPADFIYPLFVIEGEKKTEPINSMPGVSRFSLDLLVEEVKQAYDLGVPAVALFAAIDDSLKDEVATESHNPDGLMQRAIRTLKEKVPEVAVITDVAMDPFSSEGHDGYVEDGKILNDPTLEILAKMSVSQAEAGADMVAPSDMMDGRVGVIRQALDEAGFEETGILAYSAKYASSFYGPFREALDSAPRHGDKKTYQMDFANSREAVREVLLDIEEGADMVMVKPGMPYLDVIAKVREISTVPVAAYQVSGEYAMIEAVTANGWMDGEALMTETLTSIKRAGADMILTYFAKRMAERLQ